MITHRQKLQRMGIYTQPATVAMAVMLAAADACYLTNPRAGYPMTTEPTLVGSVAMAEAARGLVMDQSNCKGELHTLC